MIKTLKKSPLVFKKSKSSLLPINVKNMVKLQCYYETDDDIHLVLEYQQFGEIYEVISRIFVDEFVEEDLNKVRRKQIKTSFFGKILFFPSFSG